MSGDIWRPYIQPLKVQLICLSVIVISTSIRGHTRRRTCHNLIEEVDTKRVTNVDSFPRLKSAVPRTRMGWIRAVCTDDHVIAVSYKLAKVISLR